MKKWHPAPLALAVLVISFMVLDLLFVYIAKTNYNGPYTDNAFYKGLSMDRLRAEAVYQPVTGWKATLQVSRDKVRVYLYSAEQPLLGLQVMVKILRPVTNKFDQVIALKEEGGGWYTASYPLLADGQWEFRIKAEYKDDSFVYSEKIIFK